uniref:Putative secreted peptide n=1 Tax=Anopheles braziliensis TaxID=58242 RepID=A0A2M3ZW39_9DIPT
MVFSRYLSYSTVILCFLPSLPVVFAILCICDKFITQFRTHFRILLFMFLQCTYFVLSNKLLSLDSLICYPMFMLR